MYRAKTLLILEREEHLYQGHKFLKKRRLSPEDVKAFQSNVRAVGAHPTDVISINYVPRTLKYAVPHPHERNRSFEFYGVNPDSLHPQVKAAMGRAQRLVHRAGLASGGQHQKQAERDGITSFRFKSGNDSRRFAKTIRREIPDLDYEHTPVQVGDKTHHDVDIYHKDHLLPAVSNCRHC